MERLREFYGGSPGPGQIIACWAIADILYLPQNFAGSYVIANTPATTPSVFIFIQQPAAVVIGAASFAAAGTVAALTTVNPSVALVPGDSVCLVAPVPPDATLADIAAALVAERHT